MRIKKILLSSSRKTKQFLVALTDTFSFSVAIILAGFVSNLDLKEISFSEFLRILWIPIFSVFIFYLFGVYRSVLRYIDFALIYLLFKAILFSFLCNFILRFALDQFLFPEHINRYLINEAGWVAGLLCSIVLVVGLRIFAYFVFSNKSEKRVVIYGAGSAGIQLSEALKVSSEMEPVAFFDSNPKLENTFLGGIKILSPNKLEKFIKRKRIDEVLIAMPSASRSILSDLLEEIEGYSIKVRILPGLAALAQGKVSVSELKEIEVSDLLGRLEVEANLSLLDKNIKDKAVLVTGAGGSIGSEISRQASKIGAKRLILLDSSEYALYQIKSELERKYEGKEIISVIGNVTDKKRIENIIRTLSVDTIYHAAAYKHVSLVEENPFEGFFNNVIGTKVCLETAIKNSVETFVLISTDKAVRPTNIMGATKRLAEMILQSYSMDESSKTKMTMVRFGNVLGSSGSAIPLFQKQISHGGPVTVTHRKVTRYFMSIPEAAELVIQAGALGKGGDVLVLDMGKPVNIYELAKRLINLSGLKLKDENNSDGDIEITFTGLRPGEKLYEELLIGNNVSTTSHNQIFRAEEVCVSKDEIQNIIDKIIDIRETNDIDAYKDILEKVIHGYEKEDEIVDILFVNDQKLN